MKKLEKLLGISILLAASFGILSCAGDSDDPPSKQQAPETIPSGYIRINYYGNADCLWIFNDFDDSEKAKQGGWPSGIKFTYQNGDFICVDLKLAESPSILGMIPLKGETKLSKGDVIFKFPNSYNEIFLKADDTTAYVSKDWELPEGISSAEFTDERTITLAGKASLSQETVSLTDKNGSVSISAYDTENLTLTLSDSIKEVFAANGPYTLTIITSQGKSELPVGLSDKLVEDWFGTSAEKAIKASSKKLGVTKSGTSALFKTWAPLANKVQLCLYKSSADVSDTTKAEKFPMTREDSGFWTLEKDISLYQYYQYAITNGESTKYVSDIWSYAASADSVASQIADIASEGVPAGWESEYTNPWTGTSYTDAVIYEMHIRDWSRAVVKDSTGKFLDIAKSNEIIDHLTDLGITHVQILPMFDYAQTNADTNYNWGYNPYHYNVPEGRYVENMQDGTDAVAQMRTMIKALHDAGIAVIMDVVYNHTNGTGDGSLYDMTVPKYFYRMNGSSYYSGSGCGNEIATNHAMVKYYVIESLKHWMNDYHINGFRFDLMGLLEKETMKEIYDELYKIDQKVMVYGEPWTGGDSGVQDGAVQAVKGTAGFGAGAFDDDFRDAIKGGEFGGFALGQLQGENSDGGIKKGLVGEVGKNKRNETGDKNLALHYIECHDNYTLFDKLVYSTIGTDKLTGEFAPLFEDAYNKVMQSPDAIAAIKKQVKLGGAYVLLSQGTPFLNGGQEFLRTKKGDPDSYSADKKGGIQWTNTPGKYNIDDVNTINLSMKDMYKDVYNTYKALIQIRKDIDAFRNGKYCTVDQYNKINGVVKYETYDSSDIGYWVLFNGTDKAVQCSLEGYRFNIDETNGSYAISSSKETISSVPASSFIILKK